MSLSKKIIYGTDKELKELLKAEPELDIIDEYGYTPLIQTTIINSISKAKILLDAGAKIDFPDLTGRTALFWAADNNNLELCQLCLEHYSDPNAYSSGGQPILVMPLMKDQQNIKNLLLKTGAKLDFAYDFLNAKLIGHSFELEGRIDIVDTKNTFIEVELEGFYLRFTMEILTNSLIDFKNNFAAKKMKKYFAHLDTIIKTLQNGTSLIRLQHYLVDIKKFLTQINSSLDSDPLILPIAFGGHAITLIKFRDQLIRCDRGEYGRKHGTVIFYNMREQNKLNKSLCRELLYKRQAPEFINEAFITYLGLTPEKTLDLPIQKTGNCSWANTEAVIPTLMYALLSEDPKNKELNSKKEALEFYNKWREWNKTRSLDFCIQSLKNADKARSAAKAALLTAILFQDCDNTNSSDREKFNKILGILSKPEYSPILECYIKTFRKEKMNPLWLSFANYLEEYGIDIEKSLQKT